jgi:hypothetical protein
MCYLHSLDSSSYLAGSLPYRRVFAGCIVFVSRYVLFDDYFLERSMMDFDLDVVGRNQVQVLDEKQMT